MLILIDGFSNKPHCYRGTNSSKSFLATNWDGTKLEILTGPEPHTFITAYPGTREISSFYYQPVLLRRYNMMRIAVTPIPPETTVTRAKSRGGA